MSGLGKPDRDSLIRLAKARARQAKLEAEAREKIMLAEIEDQITAEYSKRDELWNELTTIVEEAARKANDHIVAACADLGIPASQAPRWNPSWYSRSPGFLDPKRRGELRKLAQSRLTALTKDAKTQIDRQALDVETALLAGGLESGEAHELLAAMPTVEQMMPKLSLRDLGVKRWQPPIDAAGQLLTPSTPADRRRKRILQAIEAHPDASDRAIAKLADCDHKTVAAIRRRELTAGEATEEFPTPSPADGETTGDFPNSPEDGGVA